MSAWESDKQHPYLRRHPVTKVWYVRRQKKGLGTLFRTTGERTVMRARTVADIILHDWEMGKLEKEAPKLFKDVADEALAIQKAKRVGTYRNAELYIGELKKHWAKKPVTEITTGTFKTWLQKFKAEKKRATFFDYAKHMNIVLRHAYEMRYITHRVSIPNPDPKKKAGRVYTREEIAQLMEVASPDLQLQIRMALECVMRLREMLKLSWDRVNIETGVITLRADDVKTGSKTGKGRTFYASPVVIRELRERRMMMMPDAQWVFPSRNRGKPIHDNKTAWTAAKRRAGIQGRARWHDLRHTGLSWMLLEKQINPLLVSEYAGVSLRTIQSVYLHVTEDHTRPVSEAIQI